MTNYQGKQRYIDELMFAGIPEAQAKEEAEALLASSCDTPSDRQVKAGVTCDADFMSALSEAEARC